MAAASEHHGQRTRQRPDRDGFVFHYQRGSHQRYRHADGQRVTVTFHSAGETFPIGTLRSMIEVQARWAALRRPLLIR